jgi:hypothetical protein
MQKEAAPTLTVMLLGLAGCVTMPTQTELAKADFGKPPANCEQSSC